MTTESQGTDTNQENNQNNFEVEGPPSAAEQPLNNDDGANEHTPASNVQGDDKNKADDGNDQSGKKASDKDGEDSATSKKDKDGDDQAGEGKPRSRGSFQRKISKLTRRAKAAETEAERVARENAELKEKLAKYEPDENPRPQRDDFESEDEYIDAVTDWKLDQRLNENKQKTGNDQNNSQQLSPEEQELQASINDVIQEGRDAYDDFQDVVFNEELALSPYMLAEITELDNAADVLYHLGKNPDEAQKMSEITDPRELARAVARFEATLTPGQSQGDESGKGNNADDSNANDANSSKSKQVTDAPEPIDALDTSGDGQGRPLKDVPFEEYERRRNAELKAKGKSLY